MDKNEALNIAEKYAELIRNSYNLQNVFLFGSYAKGTFRDESDIDLAIVLNEMDDFFKVQLDLMKLRRKIDSRIEPHPFLSKDFNATNPLANEIMKYGVKLTQ